MTSVWRTLLRVITGRAVISRAGFVVITFMVMTATGALANGSSGLFRIVSFSSSTGYGYGYGYDCNGNYGYGYSCPTPTPSITATPTTAPVNTDTPTTVPVNTATPTTAPVNTDTPTTAPVNTATPTSAVSAPAPAPANTATPTATPTGTLTPTDTPTATETSIQTPTTVPSVVGTATLAPTKTPIPGVPPTQVVATNTAVPETETPVTMVIVHNAPRTVKGGRATICDLRSNLAALLSGCEIVSSISAPKAQVVYTLAYPTIKGQTMLTQVFTDTADFRGHSLHIFNVPFVPPTGSLHGSPATIVHVTVAATLPDSSTIPSGTTRFVVVR